MDNVDYDSMSILARSVVARREKRVRYEMYRIRYATWLLTGATWSDMVSRCRQSDVVEARMYFIVACRHIAMRPMSFPDIARELAREYHSGPVAAYERAQKRGIVDRIVDEYHMMMICIKAMAEGRQISAIRKAIA